MKDEENSNNDNFEKYLNNDVFYLNFENNDIKSFNGLGLFLQNNKDVIKKVGLACKFLF
jgi:hypothetical protein